MPVLTAPDPNEVRPKSSINPYYYVKATVMNTTSYTRRACDIYEEIEAGEGSGVWTRFQLETANEIRMLFRAATGTGGADVFKGGHLVLNDNAAWYYRWAERIGGKPARGNTRWSSHYDKSRLHNRFSREMQFEIYFPWNGIHMNWGCVLFGRYQTYNAVTKVWTTENKTWFQTEAHSSTRPGLGGKAIDPVAHIATGFVPYKLTGQNVGPRGLSPNTEANAVHYAAPPAPHAGGTLLAAQGAWPDMRPIGHTYMGCVQCGEEHGFLPSVVNSWHRCQGCDRVWCPTHGKALAWAWSGLLSRTRPCPHCQAQTELI